tara:strand:+ start:675 stop:1598 length:924 start_codon:yes stop_codon:yes gene_type:complete
MFKIFKNFFSLLQNSFLTFIYKLKPKYFFYQSFNLFQNYSAKPQIIGFELSNNTRLGNKGDILYLPNDAYLAWYLMKYGELRYPISDYINNKLEKIHSYTFIDIGANVGFTSRDVFTKNSNIKQLICVEPVKRSFLCLEKNTSNFKNKFLFNFALGKDNSTKSIYVDNSNQGNASLIKSMMNTSKYNSYHTEEIKVKSVDDFFLEIKSQIINQQLIIKIDTQLYDELIFSLLPEEIIKNTRMVCYEFTHLDKIQGPEFSIKMFSKNLDYFNYIWSEELGHITKEELIKICSKDNNIKFLETDIYLIK